jgi:hypothetical protein
MSMIRPLAQFLLLIICFSIQVAVGATLIGWSTLGVNTYTSGPFSQHQPPLGWAPPSSQIVGGFSAGVIASNGNNLFLVDTGFGPKSSSFSSMLGIYELKIDYNDFNQTQKNVSILKLLRFHDTDHKLSFPIQADFEFYGDDPKNNPVDSLIKKNRLLTGGDIDPESFRVDYKGNLWVGEEFGPFLIKLDQSGKVLTQEIAIPSITSPENPTLKVGEQPTIKTTAGFEGMAINPQGNKLYPMLEKTVIGDADKSLRIYTFDVDSERFENGYFLYQLDGKATEIRELVAVNEHEFLTIEQNEHWGSAEGQVKKVYLISIEGIQKNDFVKKTLLVDLMNLSDPVDLNNDDDTHFAFPKLTIETIIIQNKNTLLIANDNNFGERNEFIQVRLDEPLRLAEFKSPLLDTNEWEARDRNYYAWRGYHTKKLEWINIFGIFILLGLSTQITVKRKQLKHAGTNHWLLLSILLLGFFLYNYLSFYYYATQAFRDFFIDAGLYENRGPLQRSAVMGIVVMTFLLVFTGLFFYKNKYTKYTMLLFSFLLGLKGLQFISYHRIDSLMDQMIGIGRVFDWLECGCIILLFMMIVYEGKIKKTAKMHHSGQIN